MSRPFKFKQFTIKQAVNPQKVGTDSMLLGAWTDTEAKRILDIGTGTGILALMMAQKNQDAEITAIEPDLDSLNEARENFCDSPFANRIMPIHAPLQSFGAMEKFDLIISNPPYFENDFLSADEDRNRARHTNDLPVHELYEYGAELLTEDGIFSIIIPFDEEDNHLMRAYHEDLFPQRILRTTREDGSFKRSLIQFGFEERAVAVEKLLVKDANNRYSKAYIAMTKDFYGKDLSAE